MRNFVIIMASVCMGAIGQLLFRVGMKKVGPVSIVRVWAMLFKILTVPEVFIGFMLFGISSILWLSVISRNQVSYAYPMVSLGYILVLVLSALWLHEPISIAKVFGVLIIGLGVITISYS